MHTHRPTQSLTKRPAPQKTAPRLCVIRYTSGSVTSYRTRARSVRVPNADQIESIDFFSLD